VQVDVSRTVPTFCGVYLMNESSGSMVRDVDTGNIVSRLKLFFGLSRTPHGILDVATPAMAALLLLGHFPPLSTIVLGLITAFAGYTAVYALNDLIDYHVDDERLKLREGEKEHFDVDGIMVRHPVAQGLISFRSGVMWCASWGIVAIVGAYLLNPFCVVIFGIAAVMEWLYCKLLRVSHLKVIPSAVVKATGGLAGVYAVNPDPSLGFVAVIFLWLAAWEVGGQNVANDIVDMDDDVRVFARTSATVLGQREAVFVLVSAVSMAAIAGLFIYWLSGLGTSIIYPIGAVILGWKLLIQPAREVYLDPGPRTAAVLFNNASYLPASFLVLTVVAIIVPI
jgi:4-hydroxybenzoate polyprenyltransferase